MRYFRRRNSNGTWTWWASWTQDRRTVRRSTGCSTKAAAELVGARWERERADPVYAAAQGATFGVEAALFLKACEDAVMRDRMRTGTLVMYRQKAGTLVRLLGADLRLVEVHGETWTQYLELRRQDFLDNAEKEIRETTLYKEWIAFRRILHQAWRAGRFGKDPASLKPEHFSQNYQPRETALTWAEVDRLLDALPTSRRAPVAYALMTGARRSEVFAAEPWDVDHVAWDVMIHGTKTTASAARVPIPEPMRWLVNVAASQPLPFKPWPNARRGLARACVRAGVPVVTWNDLRRTFASLLVQAGVAPWVVARLLRHKSTAMVDKVYGRTTEASLGELVARQLQTARDPSVNHAGAGETGSGTTQRGQKARKPRQSSGPTGTRTRDLRIKRPAGKRRKGKR
jgi:integrase